MENILVRDYKIRCYNLQNKITPYEAEMTQIERLATKIMRENKCDDLTAYKILKKQLTRKLMKKSVNNVSLC